MWWKRAKNGRKLVKLVRIQIYHIPNVKEASKYPLSNNNNVHSITKYGVLRRLDVQIVALCAAPKRSPAGHGSKKMPGALAFPFTESKQPWGHTRGIKFVFIAFKNFCSAFY